LVELQAKRQKAKCKRQPRPGATLEKRIVPLLARQRIE
jgi:hypothetical protein